MNKKEATLEFEMYAELIRHTRMSLTKLVYVLSHFKNFKHENSFTDVYSRVHNEILDLGIKGVGPLSKYDIASAICRNHIIIDRVYIVGGGPKEAIRKLNLKMRLHKFNSISLHYVTIEEVKEAFLKRGESLLESVNGDDYESYLCTWVKTL